MCMLAVYWNKHSQIKGSRSQEAKLKEIKDKIWKYVWNVCKICLFLRWKLLFSVTHGLLRHVKWHSAVKEEVRMGSVMAVLTCTVIWCQDDELHNPQTESWYRLLNHVYCTVYTPVSSAGGLWVVQQLWWLWAGPAQSNPSDFTTTEVTVSGR